MDRCRSLWERLYPNVKKPETYFSRMVPGIRRGGRTRARCGLRRRRRREPLCRRNAGFSVGLDTDYDALKRNSYVHFKVVGAVDALPFKEGVFGTVTAQYALEHFRNPRECIGESHASRAPAVRSFS